MKINMKDIPKRSKSPICAYCRKLIAQGVNPDETLEIYRENTDPDIIVRNIGKCAEITVLEDQGQGPRFVKYDKVDTDRLNHLKRTRERTAA